MKIRFTLLLLFALFGLQLGLNAQTISLNSFSTGYSRPLDIQNAGDGRLFIVQQRGIIYVCDSLGNRNTTPFLNLSSRVSQTGNERGLLGLAFHPDYKTNGYFYVYYTQSSGGQTVVARYSVSTNPDVADFNSEVRLLTYSQPYSNHNGGCIQFGPDGYLYIGMGDGGSGGDPGNRAQNGLNLLGKMLRIDVNGPGGTYTIPPSNPFVNNSAVADEIWAIGLRNPWRFSFDRVTGDMWIGDVGQNAWEEIDFEPAGMGGVNYGWRCYEGNNTYNTSGCGPASKYENPVYVHQNSGTIGCSVTGGYRYRGGAYSAMYGVYFYADYCSGRIWKITGSPGSWTGTQLLNLGNNEFSSFGEDQFGELYVAGLSTGTIYKISEATCSPAAVIIEGAVDTLCPGESLHAIQGAGHTYQWFLNGSSINGATAPDYAPTQNGNYTVQVTNTSACSTTSSATNVIIGSGAAATLSSPADSLCANDAAVMLTTSPSGGTLTGPGISGSMFDPALAGGGTHQVTYSVSSGGCSSSASVDIYVSDPTATLTGLAASYCIDGTATLQGSPSGGTFSGPGVTGNTFTAATAGAGTHQITYQITDGLGCTASDAASTIVSDPTASFSGLSPITCGDETVTLTGTPSGGVFTGPGITGNDFVAATAGAGTHTVTYTYTDQYGCQASEDQTTAVSLAAISISGLSDTLCIDSTALLSGSPAGGTFSGPGVTGNTFVALNAGTGTHTVSYAYTDANNCVSTGTQTVVVIDNCATGIPDGLTYGNLNLYPSPNTGDFTVSFNLPKPQTVTFFVLNQLGQEILVTGKAFPAGDQREAFNIKDLTPGVYFLKFETPSEEATLTFVVK